MLGTLSPFALGTLECGHTSRIQLQQTSSPHAQAFTCLHLTFYEGRILLKAPSKEEAWDWRNQFPKPHSNNPYSNVVRAGEILFPSLIPHPEQPVRPGSVSVYSFVILCQIKGGCTFSQNCKTCMLESAPVQSLS